MLLFSFLLSASGDTEDSLKRKYVWDSPPDIYICQESKIETWIVLESLAWWSSNGIVFGNVFVKHPCETKDRGIYVVGHKDFPGKKGATVCKYTKTKEGRHLVSAKIYLNTETDARNVLYHEMGHALGMDHVYDFQNIMHPEALTIGLGYSKLGE